MKRNNELHCKTGRRGEQQTNKEQPKSEAKKEEPKKEQPKAEAKKEEPKA